ncbi:MAG: hypothetical protein O3A46_15800, partial [Candidatus Poribacteria bacterium]|nr:hypothetical protein [Candidatus Poribacteria bacterium]
HGMYCKNFSGFEEVYHIPMIVAGGDVASGDTSNARVGLHDLCPTLLDLAGADPNTHPDSRSFAPLLKDPVANESDYQTGYSEYTGGRFLLTQRVYWKGDWKFVFNGFDRDELYHLADDPYELTNLADDPAHDDKVRDMMRDIWRIVRDTGDHSLLDSHYPILRVAAYGPNILND